MLPAKGLPETLSWECFEMLYKYTIPVQHQMQRKQSSSPGARHSGGAHNNQLEQSVTQTRSI